jgi:opacity protein-like surface antigen
MKMTPFKIQIALVVMMLSWGTTQLLAQDVANPLRFQGISQSLTPGVRAQGMGGAGIASGKDASVLFLNPAALSMLNSIDIRIGGLGEFIKREQRQEWTPNRLYTGMSILFEDLWAGIDTPKTYDPWEKLQRSYDHIGPNWDQSKNSFAPLSVSAAVPFELIGVPITVGIGYSAAIDLNHYYQNNNTLSPNLGQFRPVPIKLPAVGDTLNVQWYQFSRKREGIIYGITPALSIGLIGGLNIGASMTLLNGSSDDEEHRLERGKLRCTNNKFKVDSIYYSESYIGTSDYKGTAVTLGALWRQQKFAIGASVKMPTTITRTWNRTVTLDTTGRSATLLQNGSEDITFPWQYSIGLTLTPSEKWTIEFDYDVRNYSNVEFSDTTTALLTPWVDARAFHFGVEYQAADWLVLRAGYRQDVQPFTSANEAILEDPVRGSAYSVGCGLTVWSLQLNLAYEYLSLNYEDLWQSNINFNKNTQHQISFDVGYTF